VGTSTVQQFRSAGVTGVAAKAGTAAQKCFGNQLIKDQFCQCPHIYNAVTTYGLQCSKLEITCSLFCSIVGHYLLKMNIHSD